MDLSTNRLLDSLVFFGFILSDRSWVKEFKTYQDFPDEAHKISDNHRRNALYES